MRNRALDARNFEEGLLGLFDSLCNGLRNFLGLSVADSNLAIAIANDNQSGKGETTSALYNLGYAVDEDYALNEWALLLSTVIATFTTLATVVALWGLSVGLSWINGH